MKPSPLHLSFQSIVWGNTYTHRIHTHITQLKKTGRDRTGVVWHGHTIQQWWGHTQQAWKGIQKGNYR